MICEPTAIIKGERSVHICGSLPVIRGVSSAVQYEGSHIMEFVVVEFVAFVEKVHCMRDTSNIMGSSNSLQYDYQLVIQHRRLSNFQDLS